jgi:hypothetical protein
MECNLLHVFALGNVEMNRFTCALFFLMTSAALAQKLMPGTLASSAGPDSTFDGPSSSSDARQPITGKQRIDWIVKGTIGPESLAGGLFSAGWGTLFNTPKEYGPHWQGFGERYGMRLTGIATSNVMEAGLGSIWGEDPRYTRDPEAPFKNRIGHAIKMTFMAQNREGGLMPAYARFVAIPGNNFLSNTWRADSEATANRAAIRTGLGFLGRLGSNTFEEFWPDVRQKVFHRARSTP